MSKKERRKEMTPEEIRLDKMKNLRSMIVLNDAKIEKLRGINVLLLQDYNKLNDQVPNQASQPVLTPEQKKLQSQNDKDRFYTSLKNAISSDPYEGVLIPTEKK